MKTRNRTLKHREFAFKADSVEDDGRFSGYASVFGVVDSYNEVVAAGAFKESIAALEESGDPLPALWQHFASQPIGGYDLFKEDDHGLRVGGQLLVLDIPLAKQALALMKARIVKGLSIGYYVLEDSWNEKTRVRTLTKLELVEVSIVTFPANPAAQIDAIKSRIAHGTLPNLSEFESFLREAGFSKTQAAVIANRGLKALIDRGEPEPDTQSGEALDALRAFKL